MSQHCVRLSVALGRCQPALRAASLGLLLLLGAGAAPLWAADAASAPARPALTVIVTRPQPADWPLQLPAAGNIAAWQEAIVSAEGAGGRLVAVNVQAGDTVRRGQVLARLATDTLQAELAQTRAGLAEAQALLAEAVANAQRARELQPTGVLSTQQAQQAYTAEQTARARLEALQARLQADTLRLAQTEVRAPDDGVIASRQAVIGGFAATGQELFRLIRQNRLEWRAELPAADLGRLKPGVPARLTTPSGDSVNGKVRQVAPTVDATTRLGLVYVDLPPGAGSVRAGMHVRGEFVLGQSRALSLPQSALVLRDGFQFVLRVGADQRVSPTKVQVGRRVADRVEVLSGLPADAQVVVSGGAFLTEGDRVQVVAAAPAAPAASGAAR